MSELPLAGGTGQRKWTIAEGVSEIKRELRMRERVYPSLITREKLTEEDAVRQNWRLQGALRLLEWCGNNEVKLRKLLEEGGVL